MHELPRGFTHGQVVCARRVGGVTLAEIVYPPEFRTSRHADTWVRLVVWLIIGLALYFSYGRWHSLARGEASSTGARAVGRSAGQRR